MTDPRGHGLSHLRSSVVLERLFRQLACPSGPFVQSVKKDPHGFEIQHRKPRSPISTNLGLESSLGEQLNQRVGIDPFDK
jgi:hypothetical protein